MLHNGWICWHSPPCSTRYSFLQLWNTQQFIAVDIRHCVPYFGFPGWVSGKESACQCRRRRRHGFDPWVGKIPWRRKWQAASVFLPGKSHGRRSLAGSSPWGRKRAEHDLATKWAREDFFSCSFSSSHAHFCMMDLLVFEVRNHHPQIWAVNSSRPLIPSSGVQWRHLPAGMRRPSYSSP